MSWPLRGLDLSGDPAHGPIFVPAFRPLAAAIEGIGIIAHIDVSHVTVFDRMNLFSVHDQAVYPIPVRKDGFE